MRTGWQRREPDPSEPSDADDFLTRLAQEVEGAHTGLRNLHSLPLARPVEAAWIPDGMSRDELATRIGAQRGMSPGQALTVLRLEE